MCVWMTCLYGAKGVEEQKVESHHHPSSAAFKNVEKRCEDFFSFVTQLKVSTYGLMSQWILL